MKILVVGYYGFKNVGDELILAKIIDDIKNILPGQEILIWSGDTAYTEYLHGVKGVNRFSPTETVSAVKESDIIIVGGGGLIHEYFGINLADVFTSFGYNVSAYAIVPLIVKIFGKPVFYWSHGIGPLFSEDGRKFAKWFYSLADVITVRDEVSYGFLKENNFNNVFLDIDPVCAMEMEQFLGEPLIQFPDNPLKIGINLRPWFWDEKTLRIISLCLNEIYEKHNDIIFIMIPFDLSLDTEILNELKRQVPSDALFDFDMKSLDVPEKIISLMQGLDLFIGMRLHSIVVSRLLKIPTISLSYDLKTDIFARRFDIPAISFEELSSQHQKFLSNVESLIGCKSLPVINVVYKTPEIFRRFIDGEVKVNNVKNFNEDIFSAINPQSIYERYIRILRDENENLKEDLNRTLMDRDSLREQLEGLRDENENLKEDLNRTLMDRDSLREQLQGLKDENENLKEDLNRTLMDRDSLREQLEGLRKENENLKEDLNRTLMDRDSLFNRLNEIYESDFWKVAWKYYSLKQNNRVFKALHGIAKIFKAFLKKNFIRKKDNISGDMGIQNENVPTDTEEIKEEWKEYYNQKHLPSIFNKLDIIFFPIIDWDFRFQRPQQIASRWAKLGHRVFYLKVQLKDTINNYSIRKVTENIYEVTLPYKYSTFIYSEDLRIDLEDLKSALSNLFYDYSIKESVCIVNFPMWYHAVKYLKEEFNSRIVFDILDEFDNFSNVHKKIKEYEMKMIELADTCITTSKNLFEKIKQKRKDVKLIRNATEFKHFANVNPSNVLSDIKHPIIGYYGAIAEWFDTDIVENIAKRHPDWSIVLIGHTFGSDIERLKKYKNIYLLGEKSYKDIPHYLYWFDVCMIPFKLTPLILSTNPVKFYEYISAGKPVVTTRLPDLLPFHDICYIAEDKEDFLSKVEYIIYNGEGLDVIEKRKNIAKENDWDIRVEEIKEIIKDSYPLVSIIIVTYNNIEYTRLCIESILEKTAYPNHEIIVVDNNSTDGTKDYLMELGEKYKNIRTIFNHDNLGFARANNIGIKNAKGSYIIFLNNDTIVTRGWINNLLKYFRHRNVGEVGPVTNFIGNEAKINVPYTEIVDVEKFAEYYTNQHRNVSFDIKVLAMYCVAVRKDIIEELGYLDERYEIGMFEDDDLSMALRQAGYRLLCAEDVFIHHFGGSSFKKLGNEEYKKIFEKNKKRFKEKWKTEWQPHQYRNRRAMT